MLTQIPVVDIFAGPGGFGEGFNSLGSKFQLSLSIEKDEFAHRTLLLRAFFHQFKPCGVPKNYYRYLRGDIGSVDELLKLHPTQATHAERKARRIELGVSEKTNALVDELIASITKGADLWVLIGGPPCQAYSIMGRSRRINKDPEGLRTDSRHLLYEHYLRILASHGPTIFVMENVKGLLSSKFESERIIDRIIRDLKQPCARVTGGIPRSAPNPPHCGYKLYSLSTNALQNELFELATGINPGDLVVRSEDHGIPQSRHRVFIFGVRADVPHLRPSPLKVVDPVFTDSVIGDLPHLRSRLSREPDSPELWAAAIREEYRKLENIDLLNDHWDSLVSAVDGLGHGLSTGERFMAGRPGPEAHLDWYVDPKLNGFLNHEARSHRRDDLLRYLYLSVAAKRTERTVKLQDFPPQLLPDHRSATQAVNYSHGYFNDRFRVQIADQPATTVTSHISKDGHYYIHSDPTQCRSLTVREAARIQTFPDNYFFEGSRTHQYVQVGNAVPPLLARQIAEIAHDVLMESGRSELSKGAESPTAGRQQMSTC